MDHHEIIQKFINFFQKKNHHWLPSGILAPKNNSNTLFNIAGMQQFTDIFLGNSKAPNYNALTIQPCLRTNDLMDVGVTPRHHSLFFMLGNFSFGDYFKEKSIALAFEFLTEQLKIPKKYLYITCHIKDKESFDIWSQIHDQIVLLGDEDNFWQAGNTGPCGYCSEIFFHIKQTSFNSMADVQEAIKNNSDDFLEIWNIVFMEFDQREQKRTTLKTKFIDTGMGLERISSVLEGHFDNFKSSSLAPIYNEALKTTKDEKTAKILSDHLRSIVFLIMDGLRPGNEAQEYILRNLIRRCFVHCKDLNSLVSITFSLVQDIRSSLKEPKQETTVGLEEIQEILRDEREKFNTVLKKTNKIIKKQEKIDEDFVFKLLETHGLPLDISLDLFKEHNLNYNIILNKQQQHSKISKSKVEVSFYTPTIQMDLDLFQGQSTMVFMAKKTQEGTFESVDTCAEGDTDMIFVTKESCFYGEGGGQPGDKGIIFNDQCLINITSTQKQKISPSVYVCLHQGFVKQGKLKINDKIFMEIDQEFRKSTTRAHSAAHIVTDYLVRHHNLTVVGAVVSEDSLRIDVESETDLKEIIPAVEQHCEEVINKAIDRNIIIDDFHKIQGALSGDRHNYDDVVRCVEYADVSKQLCGGTHVKNTRDIQRIVIKKESSVKRGVRRLVFATGLKSKEIEVKPVVKKTQSLDLLSEEKLLISGQEINLMFFKGNCSKKILKNFKKKPEESFLCVLSDENKNTLFMCNIQRDMEQKLRDFLELKGGGNDKIKSFHIQNSKNIEAIPVFLYK